MSEIRANSITDAAGTGAPDFPNGLTDNSNAVLNSSSSLPAANLTGTLPAINGSALTDLPGSYTHLGTIATTSGAMVTLSGLTLTSYKFLFLVYDVVSFTGTAAMRLAGSNLSATIAATAAASGSVQIDLTNGVAVSCGSTGHANAAPSGLTTASTSISLTTSSGNFDAGSVRVYGVK
jgi:hypothetical protein